MPISANARLIYRCSWGQMYVPAHNDGNGVKECQAVLNVSCLNLLPLLSSEMTSGITSPADMSFSTSLEYPSELTGRGKSIQHSSLLFEFRLQSEYEKDSITA